MIRRERKDGREARGNEEREQREDREREKRKKGERDKRELRRHFEEEEGLTEIKKQFHMDK